MKELNGIQLEEDLSKYIPEIIKILSKGFDVLIKLNKDNQLKIMLSKPINYKADK